jgi:hypothetical protein
MRVHVLASRRSAAGSSEDEWFGMQLTVSSFDFCLPASRAADSLKAPHTLTLTSAWLFAARGSQHVRKRNVR